VLSSSSGESEWNDVERQKTSDTTAHGMYEICTCDLSIKQGRVGLHSFPSEDADCCEHAHAAMCQLCLTVSLHLHNIESFATVLLNTASTHISTRHLNFTLICKHEMLARNSNVREKASVAMNTT
jgi:hypothetical protein